jgi:hypothetical protein
MFGMAVGHSADVDEKDAVAEALAQCGTALSGGVPPGAVFVFASVEKDYARILAMLHDAFGDVPLIGCTTDGELSSCGGFEEDSLVVAVMSSDSVDFACAAAVGSKSSPQEAAAQAVAEARAQLKGAPALCVTFPNALGTSGALVLDGLKESLGAGVAVVGGVAADQWRFEVTHQFCNGKVFDDAVPVILFSDPIAFSHGVCSGWRPIGKAGVITAVDGNVVLSVDDEPTINFYRRYLGDQAVPSSEYPLAVYPEGQERFRLLTAVSHDSQTGSVKLASVAPLGSQVRVTQATRDDVLAAAGQSVSQAMDGLDFEPKGALFVSCAARKQILGTRTGEEVGHLSERVGADVPFAGLYAYGEISPLQRGGAAEYHTESVVSLILGEAR